VTKKRKRGPSAPATDPPRQVIRDHARWLRSERGAVEALWRATWECPVDEATMLRDREAAKADPETSEARAWLLTESVRHCERLATTALDHVLALGKCIAGRPLPHYASMTLARSVLEAVVQFCYLTDCEIDADSRLIRGAAVLLDSARQEQTAVRGMRPSGLPPGTVDLVTSMRSNVEAWIVAAGMEIQTVGKSKRVVLSWPQGGSVNLSVNVTDELPKYISSVESAYRVGSGAAHGRQWMLHDRADEAGGVYMACGAADLAFAALSALAVRSAQYAGHDATDVGSRIAGRRQASGQLLMALSATGFNSLGRYADEPRLTGPPGPSRPGR
jgi:hypothetical protein